MAERTCPACEETFPIHSGPGAPQKFCSEDCRYGDKNRIRRARRGHSYEHNASMNNSAKQSETIDLSPAGWAAWVFKNHDLDGSKQQLVMLGLEILTVARDSEEDIKTRMNAMGRFQAILSQLNLPKLEVEEVEEDTPIISVVRPSVDPRKHLRAVS